jgi:hypothetical protein
VLELWDVTRKNSKARVQDKIKMHNQEKWQLVQVEWKWCDGFSGDNLKHKFYTACNLWEEATFPFL